MDAQRESRFYHYHCSGIRLIEAIYYCDNPASPLYLGGGRKMESCEGNRLATILGYVKKLLVLCQDAINLLW